MSLHTKIDETVLPVQMAAPNRLVAPYESYVLIPNLGPLLYARLHERLAVIVGSIAASMDVIDRIREYREKFHEYPPTPCTPDDLPDDDGVLPDEISHPFLIDEAYERTAQRPSLMTLRALNRIGPEAVRSSRVSHRYGRDDDGRMEHYRDIVAAFSKPNPVIRELAEQNLLFHGKPIISYAFMKKPRTEQLAAMLRTYRYEEKSDFPEPVQRLGKSLTETLLKREPGLQKFHAEIARTLSPFLHRFLDSYEIANPEDHIRIVESCEWAFLRKERVFIDLAEPRFRGPLAVNSVAPNSERATSLSQTRMVTSSHASLTSRQSEQRHLTSVATEIRDSLGTLFDHGAALGQDMSEQGYSQETLKEEKRARVESALHRMSSQSSLTGTSATTLSTAETHEYRTSGKSERHATTEVAFDVVCPVTVTHRLEEIGAVWAPRVSNPFKGLRILLDDYYRRSFHEYVNQNYVIDPTEPVVNYENKTRIEKRTAPENEPGDFTRKVVFDLDSTEIEEGYDFGDDIRCRFECHLFFDLSHSFSIHHVKRNGANTRVEITVKYHVEGMADFLFPSQSRHCLCVSIDKRKLTETSRQELREYAQTTRQINPARRNAVKAQATRYATLKRDELIRKYEADTPQLTDLAFTAMIRDMFSGSLGNGNWSYYHGILRSCIDWEACRLDPEPADLRGLYEDVLSPCHFLNVHAVRFFLPIRPGAEAVFFDVMEKVLDPQWRSLFHTVHGYIRDQREAFHALHEDGLTLDTYESELVLGRHLEAVLSQTEFRES